ncbi:MAG: Uma2 family endonuclease, partial [Thermoanaerobaculia bacterium]
MDRDTNEPSLEPGRRPESKGVPTTLSAEDLPYLEPEVDRVELVAGSIVRQPPPGSAHGGVSLAVGSVLRAFVRENGLGRAFGESGYVLASDPDTVRAPDASFVSEERLAAAGWRGPYRVGAPNLAVEVASPRDSERALAAKAGEYLAAGGRTVWVLDPERRTVTVHRP